MSRRPKRSSGLDGVVVVDKPAGMTSHDVVARLRRVLGEPRIGHAGTLDPDATGVLVVAVGRSTRLLRFLGDSTKTYAGEIVLGVETTTLDAAGEVTARYDMGAVTPAEVARAAGKFLGESEQIPPMVSALKVGGRRLYELARAGEEVEHAPRRVVISSLDVHPTSDPLVYLLELECSSGTYVRSLVADIGHELGGGAHLRSLRRHRVGRFDLAMARPLEEIGAGDVGPPLELLRHLEVLRVDHEAAAVVANGGFLDAEELSPVGSGPYVVLDADEVLLGVYEPHRSGALKPIVVHRAAPATSGDSPVDEPRRR